MKTAACNLAPARPPEAQPSVNFSLIDAGWSGGRKGGRGGKQTLLITRKGGK